jgi:hypothetical protein
MKSESLNIAIFPIVLFCRISTIAATEKGPLCLLPFFSTKLMGLVRAISSALMDRFVELFFVKTDMGVQPKKMLGLSISFVI